MQRQSLKYLIFTLLFVCSFCFGYVYSTHLHVYKIVVVSSPRPDVDHVPDYKLPPVNKNKIPATLMLPQSVEDLMIAEETNCLAKNIYFESGNQSAMGKEAVGIVVLNRVKDDNYPDTICEVVFQKYQFSWYWDERSDDPMIHDPQWEVSKNVARQLIIRYNTKEFNSEFDATHYHADYVNPYWAKKKTVIAKIDNHIFYR